MDTSSFLDQIRVASPCNARWEDMAGDDRARFCGSCRKNVFNFSAMTAAEVAALVREKEGRLCGRYFQRADGRMLTADCPTGVTRRRSRAARFVGSLFATVLFLIGGRAYVRAQDNKGSTTPAPKLGEVVKPPVKKRVEPLMGDVCISPLLVTTNPPLLGKIAMPQIKPATNAPSKKNK